ncbi:MAG: aminoacyl-histidine dipeptidase [Bacteroidetes bacterium]|nr:aminoacyl-histidine dipeptidase [Bacteroidota bacterium]
MSKEILNLEPKAIWKHFYSLTQIPRPSGHEAACIAFMKKFGEDLGLETVVDPVGNVIIRKPATPGMESRKGVVLQGHLDMVPQKNSDKNHDFEKDPIETIIDGEWVRANGTTLGADNGMGVAAAMAILEAKDLQHGMVEALFTIDEETGMTGAFGLQAGYLKGDILMNLDSEDEGELYIGCAGGTNGNITYTYAETDVPANSTAYKLNITGLKGGHSGVDIHLGRGNANKIMNRFLKEASNELGLRIATLNGGSLRNAIPRESFAIVTIPSANQAAFTAKLKEFETIIKKELSAVEPDLKMEVVSTNMPSKVMDSKNQKTFIDAVYACPNGVVRMSNAMEGLVETSNNLAIIEVKEGTATALCLLRSSVDSAKADLESQMESVFHLAGAEITFDGQYPGWKPNPDSPILKKMLDIYNNQFGNIPKIYAIHAGLECGLLGGVYPNWDMISFGPTIRFPHSPDEKVNIASVTKFWDFLVETLKNVPIK